VIPERPSCKYIELTSLFDCYDRVSLEADLTKTPQSGTLWTMIITTAECIIKTTQPDRTDGVLMLYADQNLMKFNKSKR